jgi:hypothetical protein
MNIIIKTSEANWFVKRSKEEILLNKKQFFAKNFISLNKEIILMEESK